ncbi:MAG: hypothetical protein IKO32_08980 [Lachnospiraceae bacterium]|nr:hypothetical protein [Lachnospiraceae bacterium]
MKKNSKIILQTIITGVLAAFCCIGLLLVSSLIPQDKILKHAEESALYFESKELFEYMVPKQDAVKRDNYADCITFDIAYHLGNTKQIEGTDRSNAFVRILEARYTRDEDENVDDGFKRAVTEGAVGNQTYSRYWHGGAAVVRLLLSFFDVSRMRVLFFVTGILLNLAWVVYLVIRKDFLLAISFLCGITAGKILFGYTCFEYAFVCLFVTVFSFLVYFAMQGEKGPEIVSNEAKRKGILPVEALFLSAGILTCFFDFLTAETAVLTIPAFVAVYCLENRKKSPFTVKYSSAKDEKKESPWIFLLRIALCWFVGYALMFGLKWGLSALVLGPEEAASAFTSVAERTVGDVHETLNLASPTVGFAKRVEMIFLRNFSCLYSIPNDTKTSVSTIIILGIPMILYIIWFFFRDKENIHEKKGKKDFSFLPLYLVIALIPVLRFLVLSNHAYLHYFFTYRALMADAMIFTYIFLQTTILSNLLQLRPSQESH